MKRASVKPDEVTFLGVLTACSHAGLVSEGREMYDNMINLYGVHPRVDHCACMIDLFGRWGFLGEAEKFIDNLDFEPDSMIWATYLSACRLHGDDIRGQRAAEKLIELEPQNSLPYVLLSHIHAASGNWDSVNSVRKKMTEKGVKKFQVEGNFCEFEYICLMMTSTPLIWMEAEIASHLDRKVTNLSDKQGSEVLSAFPGCELEKSSQLLA
ncbi:hypothetical protein BUALT_Bualt10G0052000 [Buddleja alternifolia]|uniref:Pentatricopeptide repeat-containing protein n=1 Tax=Buddleja alternifolia TaxID=168488 RepID=A0AAV6X6Z3_9LAMI|nr:hypothetical protein BUALT_Bualt10G0052000 [Buddleja alternifolia]